LANDRYHQLVGHRELIGKSVREAFPEVDGQGFFELLDRVYATGEPFVGKDMRIMLRGQPGHPLDERFLDFVYQPTRDPDGAVTGIFAHGIDLTDRKRLEERARAMLESITDAFFSLDSGWRFTYVNKQAEKVLGRGPGDLLGKSLWAEYPGLHGSDIERAYHRAVDEQVAVSVTAFYPDHDRWYEVHAYPAPDGISVYFRDVTEAKRAEAEMRESEAKFRQLADAMPQIVWAAGPDGTLNYYNRRWFEYINLSPAATEEARWDRYIHPDDLKSAYDTWAESIQSGRPYGIEFRVRRADGEYRWFLARALPVRDDGGKVLRWFGTCTDIHDRKLAEAALRHSRDQVEIVVKGANVGVWYCPLPFDKLIWDETVKEHFHLPRDADVTIDTFYQRLHPDDRERTRQTIEASIGRRQPYDIDYRTVSADGQKVKWVRASGRGFYDAAGNPTRFDGITIDMTERVRAEERVSRLYAVAAALSEAVTPKDVARVAVHQGIAAVGATAGSLALLAEGSGYLEMAGSVGYPPEVIARWQRFPLDAPIPLAEAVRRGEPVYTESPEERLVRYPALAPVNALQGTHASACLPLTTGGRAVGVLGLSFDRPGGFSPDDREFMLSLGRQCGQALERARLFEAERRARAEAERASRMKDEFLATLSHELRTPLNAILGWSQILAGGGRDPEDVAEGLGVIERNARAQTTIIEDLLDMSRIISGKVRLDVQRVDLTAVVHAAVETVKPAADAKGVRLQLVLDAAAGPVSGDSSRLQQVFWNLLSNGVKFTPRGGRVQVLLERVNSHLQVSVIDTGEGIKPDFLPHVFDRFRQSDGSTTRRHGGLGLGLAIVKQLVELHGGEIRAKSPARGRGRHSRCPCRS
jgi:PAS domain S-box-containing protein